MHFSKQFPAISDWFCKTNAPSGELPKGRIPIQGIAAAFLLFFTLPLLFALYTGNTWEDYYITFRASKNLAMGNGLVFTPGQHIHSFTSPLGTLFPALCSYLAGPTHDDVALWLFRILSAAVLGCAGTLLYAALRKNIGASIPIWTGLILLAEDSKTVMFSSNGMETAFMLFFLGLSVYALVIPHVSPWKLLGIAWGGIMWSRPDGFIYAGAWAVAYFIVDGGRAQGSSRAQLFGQYFKAALLAAVIYLPWFIWAWSYYGSPIPHTIVAKGLHAHHQSLGEHLGNLQQYAKGGLFMPAYFMYGGWNNPDGFSRFFRLWAILLQLLVFIPLILPRVPPLLRTFSLTYLLSFFYIGSIPYPFPWYIPNATWAGYLAVGLFLYYVSTLRPFSSRYILPAIAVVLIACQTLFLLCVGQQMHAQQAIIEANRKQIGLWLKDQAQTPHDTVFLECLGYIGFFSNLKMYDFPGMSSDEVVQARAKLGSDEWPHLIRTLKPDWLVLRPGEAERLNAKDPQLLTTEYEPRRTFDVTDKVSALSIQGKSYLENDETFTVYHRKP